MFRKLSGLVADIKRSVEMGSKKGTSSSKAASKKSKNVKTKPAKPVAKVAVKTVAKVPAKLAAKTSKAPAKAAPVKENKVSASKQIKPVKSPATKPVAVMGAAKASAKVEVEGSGKRALTKEVDSKSSKVAEMNLVEKAAAAVASVEEVPVAELTADQAAAERKAFLKKVNQAGSNWETIQKLAKNLRPKTYKMSETYETKTPILHKVLGWGFIMVSENNRIQVLFKDGIKTLITNYQAR